MKGPSHVAIWGLRNSKHCVQSQGWARCVPGAAWGPVWQGRREHRLQGEDGIRTARGCVAGGPRGLCVAVTAGLRQRVTYADFNKTACVQVSHRRGQQGRCSG